MVSAIEVRQRAQAALERIYAAAPTVSFPPAKRRAPLDRLRVQKLYKADEVAADLEFLVEKLRRQGVAKNDLDVLERAAEFLKELT